MKRELLNKIKSYSAAAAGLMVADVAVGQIVYTNVDPDVDVAGNFDAEDWKDETAWATHQIDLDDDGNADYTLRVRSDKQHGAGFLDPTEGNEYVNNPNDNPFGAPLDEGTQIGGDENQVWKGLLVYPNGYNYLGTLTTLGKTLEEGGGGWTGKTDKYLGLKFKIGTNTHYGWARLDVRDDSRVYTLKDYAYESTPDTPINAGEGLVGVNDLVNKGLKVYSAGNDIHVFMNKNTPEGNVYIYNVTGQEVQRTQINNNKMVINFNEPTGVYFVKVMLKEGEYTEKVFIR